MTAPTAEPPVEPATRRGRSGNGDVSSVPEPPKLRRRPMLIALSILLTALGALLGAWLLTSLSGTDSYVAVRADIERGQVIKETDLVRAELSSDPALDPVAWDQQGLIVGKYATYDMAKGSIVTRQSVAASISPQDGMTLVGLALVPGQTVTGELRTGQDVRVVLVPASADSSSTRPPSYQGKVAGSRMSEDGSTKLVDVMVLNGIAPEVASAASRQEVSLVLDSAKAGNGDTPTDTPGDTPTDGSSSSPSSSTSN